ncbi:hypothetical protein [Actinospongicola halichondriae]|uniref:hypothetical protein n=1 Tax=Actinospongicola halichondriae TaxID=3236844 RepID=UPI003D3ABD34
MGNEQRFDLRYSWTKWPLTILGMGPKRSWIEVDDSEVRVRMGWAFSATIPRDAVTDASEEPMKGWLGIGVHGFGSRWQVNGALGPGVEFTIDPAVRSRVAFFFVRLRMLRVGAADPAAVIAALSR